MRNARGPLSRLRLDESITRQRIRPGTIRRILPYALRHRWSVLFLLLATAADATATAVQPLILKAIIDDGIIPRRTGTVVAWALVVTALAVLNSAALLAQAWFSGRVGEGLIYDLRTAVYDHVQRQSVAFFCRTQTGALVSRLNTDVVGAEQAVTALLTQTTSTLLSLVLVLSAMFYLSWQISLVVLLFIPLFLIPGKVLGRRMQRLSREQMQLDAEVGSLMNERFTVAGSMLVQLYGRPRTESARFAERVGRIRDVAVVAVVHSRLLVVIGTLLAALTSAVVYGLGGVLAVRGSLELGTLVAMAALLTRLYGPINQLSNMQASFMTALVSFDRVFEVLDLRPLVTERKDARPLLHGTAAAGDRAPSAPEIVFEGVSFRYPTVSEVSLASLESIGLPATEQPGEGWILDDVSFRLPAGTLTALVGPSGAGKSTVAQLLTRLYDPVAGTVRVDGHDLRELTLPSLRDAVGVVSQDAHLFHDTLRANLAYGRPDATDAELREACVTARIWDVISALPNGLDTVVGDHGYRLSGGEKQRVALARLLLKSPPVVLLDEATAHLDSESEVAIQRGLTAALADRTSLVIAHRLSTIRDADQILVLDSGRIRECGTHAELLAADGLYALMYRTQFALGADPGDAVDGLAASGSAEDRR
ncbi:ABC transporter ATP-binding protein [Streptomyces sp. NPDC007901]|uniref:ABC transporter ATP-binding protein n=1 Tax=Streptomyces sp. NPDC007901 TaxID=3364785 RepID=UPI0036E601EB